MAFQLNKDVREKRIQKCYEDIKNQIQLALNKGQKTIELYFPGDIYSEVMDLLEVDLKDTPQLSFATVRRAPNEYTGQMQYFTSEKVGDQRYRKLVWND